VARRDRTGETRTNALIELMNCASFRRDRLAFERAREMCLDGLSEREPNVRADYYMKVGIGLARFANFKKAEGALRQALEIASAHGLHELTYRTERIMSGLHTCESPDSAELASVEPRLCSEALREVSASLAALSS
jgi:hypothetical protein